MVNRYNGDNIYDASFLDSLSSSSDLVAFDFYSRHVSAMDTRYVGEGCERYFFGAARRL